MVLCSTCVNVANYKHFARKASICGQLLCLTSDRGTLAGVGFIIGLGEGRAQYCHAGHRLWMIQTIEVPH